MQKRWIIIFILVVISEALCSQDFIYTAQCNSNKAVHVDVSGKVSLMNISKVQQEITAMPKKHSGAEIAVMALWVKENNRYICFNEKWRIVGKKRVDDKCYFIEKSKGGYRHFVSAVNESKVLAFTKRGKAIGPAMKVNLKHRCDTFSTIEKSEIEFLLEKNTTTIKPQSNLSVVGKSSRSQSIEANSHKHKLKQGMHKRRHHHNQNHHRAMRSSSSSSTTTTTTTTTPPPMSSSSNSFHKSPSNILNSVLALHGVIPKKSGSAVGSRSISGSGIASHRLRSQSLTHKPTTQFLNPKDPKHFNSLKTQYYSSQEDANSDNNSSSRSSRSSSNNRLFSSNFEYSNDDEEDDDANAKQNLPQNVHSIDNIYNSRNRHYNKFSSRNSNNGSNTSNKRKHKHFLFRQKNNKNINFIPT